MAFKEFPLNDEQSVIIYKRQSSRSLRLSVTSTGQIRVTIPRWVSYRAGLAFARSKQSWLAEQQHTSSTLRNGQTIGKAHHLRFMAEEGLNKPVSRLNSSEIIIRYPQALSQADPSVQKVALNACIRALRSQAENLLPQRLQSLAKQYDFQYTSVSVRQLKSRWGSCDQTGHIILNIYLLQLPWELIDYVLLHELTHIQILRHGPDFWRAMETHLPPVKQRRKEIKRYQPTFNSSTPQTMA
jgi:predicted metal-dependent hydrolase